MRRDDLATLGLFGAAFLTASCCLAPTLFILFGISAGALAKFAVLEPYRPLFISAGGLAMVYAGRRIYRSMPADGPSACSEGACATDSPSRGGTRILFWIASVVFVVAVVYPWVLSTYLERANS